MNNKAIQTVVHVLALVSGLCSLLAVALTQPPFDVPPIVAGGFALAATVLTYLANQLPALGEPVQPAEPSLVPPESQG